MKQTWRKQRLLERMFYAAMLLFALLGVCGIFLQRSGHSSLLQVMVAALLFVFLVGYTVGILLRFCRCPQCGNFFYLKSCFSLTPNIFSERCIHCSCRKYESLQT